MSHPPSSSHGSHAADFAHYFHPSTYWSEAWYNTSNIQSLCPPILSSRHDLSYSGSWLSSQSQKTIHIAVTFSDLSICWASVSFDTSSNADPNDLHQVHRDAIYLPAPSPLSKDILVEASETYGETIARFAESFAESGEYCARGECWDLASEALKYFAQFDHVPQPVRSLSRTHGHLIFEGKAGTGARWRGGDRTIRRGDIVEWRNVRIDKLHGGYAILGDPDHTAIIVSNSSPPSNSVPAEARSITPLSEMFFNVRA